jgi:hypothetical protein
MIGTSPLGVEFLQEMSGSMSGSTTTAGSQAQIQEYPDRQPEFEEPGESEEISIAPDSLNPTLTQVSQSTQSVSATPSQAEERQRVATTVEDKVRADIARMNEEFAKHKYEAFVHKKMHLIFKVYPFDLEWCVFLSTDLYYQTLIKKFIQFLLSSSQIITNARPSRPRRGSGSGAARPSSPR